MRNLVIVLGDQLDHASSAFDSFASAEDCVWMAETDQEFASVRCHKLRIALFLSAMRHFRSELQAKGWMVEYHALGKQASMDRGVSFDEILQEDVKRLKPERLLIVQPGDLRIQNQIRTCADRLGIELQILADRHFYCSPAEFAEHANGRKSLRLEYFYRGLRKKHNILMKDKTQPEGGQWNFDHDNRQSFGESGPGDLPQPKIFRSDSVDREVIALVQQRYPKHPGGLQHLTLPVTRQQAQVFLNRFIDNILPHFGRWEDAMWTDEAFLYHSRLSAPLNMKLLNPQECVTAAVQAYRSGKAPLNSVEGFVRQILGWREFIRGVYWLKMPEYLELNHFDHQLELPSFFWDGETEMNCVKQSMQHVMAHGYTHHIQRLMVLGNFALLWGVHPRLFHEWHMAMYVDAVDWVSLPNTLGMSQYGDGGIVGSKPYCSSGNYINKMSDFCKHCRFDYRKRVGADACPFTTLYWDFMDRNSEALNENPRMKFPMKNLDKMRTKPQEMAKVKERAGQLRTTWG